MRIESSGKPDAGKLARPVWGWGRGETPRPTPPFVSELAKIVSHLSERLSGEVDGKPKVFRDSAVNNLVEFFERFRELNVRSSEQLDGLVADCQRIVRGVGPQELRDNQQLREHVATELSQVQSVLDGLLVDRPRRNILRRPK